VISEENIFKRFIKMEPFIMDTLFPKYKMVWEEWCSSYPGIFKSMNPDKILSYLYWCAKVMILSHTCILLKCHMTKIQFIMTLILEYCLICRSVVSFSHVYLFQWSHVANLKLDWETLEDSRWSLNSIILFMYYINILIKHSR
jgi:hypothetical protein